MKRYTLQELYEPAELKSALETKVSACGLMLSTQYASSVYSSFISNAIYNAFYEDEVNYVSGSEDEETAVSEIKEKFINRMGYDIAVKFPYWKTKYDYIMKLLDPSEINLLQSSKMISSSNERVDNAGGTLQKSATTPTGVSSELAGDELNIETTSSEGEGTQSLDVEVSGSGFVDKYTNYQGKTNTASKSSAQRSGTILREGSVDELLNVLEKLPSSFADEVTREVCKHFVFVYSY